MRDELEEQKEAKEAVAHRKQVEVRNLKEEIEKKENEKEDRDLKNSQKDKLH
jgi:hypothetical protein